MTSVHLASVVAKRLARVAASLLVAAVAAQPARAAESRSYVVHWFAPATNSDDHDCDPGGVNPQWERQRLKNLAALGYSPEQIGEMAAKALAGKERGDDSIDRIMFNRARIDGKPANAVAYPAAVPDPKLNAITGRYAYGFDLDGKGRGAPAAFEDPETHETGVENALHRVLGCVRVFRGTLANPPTYWVYIWGQLTDSQPAWIVTLSGEDLSKDGAVTVTFDRALEHLRSNADGSPRADATYRIDPDPRSHNVFSGRLRAGTVTLAEPGSQGLRMLLNPLLLPEWRLDMVHMRIKLDPDGTMESMVGGFQPWADLYAAMALQGSGIENAVTGDLVGIYYLMRKYADAAPDPKTGQNASLSATYYIRGVPAFAQPAEPGRMVSVR